MDGASLPIINVDKFLFLWLDFLLVLFCCLSCGVTLSLIITKIIIIIVIIPIYDHCCDKSFAISSYIIQMIMQAKWSKVAMYVCIDSYS